MSFSNMNFPVSNSLLQSKLDSGYDIEERGLKSYQMDAMMSEYHSKYNDVTWLSLSDGYAILVKKKGDDTDSIQNINSLIQKHF